MKLVQYDRIPRKYHLWWDGNAKAIMIDIHKDCLKFFPHPITKDWPMVGLMAKDHNYFDDLFDSFSGNLNSESFGFNKMIQKVNNSGDYFKFRAPLPRIRIETELPCKKCEGTGKHLDEHADPNEICRWCKGSGKKRVSDWKPAYALASSLDLLFGLLDFDEVTSAKEYQHVAVTMVTRGGRNNTAIGGWFGPDLCDYIADDKPELKSFIVNNVSETMKLVNNWMYLNDNNPYIRTDCYPEGICWHVDSDACYAGVSLRGRKQGEGCDFSDHNVDNILQQLTILAGIASLVGQASFYIEAQGRQANQK